VDGDELLDRESIVLKEYFEILEKKAKILSSLNVTR
jgi:hypothetical protein